MLVGGNADTVVGGNAYVVAGGKANTVGSNAKMIGGNANMVGGNANMHGRCMRYTCKNIGRKTYRSYWQTDRSQIQSHLIASKTNAMADALSRGDVLVLFCSEII